MRSAAPKSFKVRLIVYFALLSLLPIGAAFWGFTSVAGHSETRRVDARLYDELDTSLVAYQQRLDDAQRIAVALAAKPQVQILLSRRDARGLGRLLRGSSAIAVTTPKGLLFGARTHPAVVRRATVVAGGRLLGTVNVYVPLNAALVTALRREARVAPDDVLAVLVGRRVVVSSPSIRGTIEAVGSATQTVVIGRARYRALVTPGVAGASTLHFAVLSPQAVVDAANSAARDQLLLGLLVSLALVTLVAYFEGRSIVRTVRSLADAAHAIAKGRLGERVPVQGRDELAQLGRAFNDMAAQLEHRLTELEAERGRLREAIDRFGDALQATHDAHKLASIIVEAALEGSGAEFASLRTEEGSRVESGNPAASGERLELTVKAGLQRFGTLVLVGAGFDEEQRLTAASLASHAAVAFDNARLHRLVERQARVDSLTGIANRRQCEDALHTEIARAERHDVPLTLVLADLDNFKSINDEHGHEAGDNVLRAFAAILKQTVREVDVAARWGGEEFALLLPGTDPAGAIQLAERVRHALSERTFSGRSGATVLVTCSCGVAQHRPGAGERALFSAADQALYRAKQLGKNRVEAEARVRSIQ